MPKSGDGPIANQVKTFPYEGKTNSFDALFNHFYPSVLMLFRRRGFAEGDCDDLAQETFLKAYRNFSTYRGEAPFEHWLFRIASNTAKAALRFEGAARRAAIMVPFEETGKQGQEPAMPDDPLRSIMASERSEQLLTAVGGLPPKMRRCVLLFLKQGLRYSEIGEVLQISEQTVKVHFLKARRALRETWAKSRQVQAHRK